VRSKAAFAPLNVVVSIGVTDPNLDRDVELAAGGALWGNCLTLRVTAHLVMFPDLARVSTLLCFHLTHIYAGFEAFDRWVRDFAHMPSLTVSQRRFRFLGFFACRSLRAARRAARCMETWSLCASISAIFMISSGDGIID